MRSLDRDRAPHCLSARIRDGPVSQQENNHVALVLRTELDPREAEPPQLVVRHGRVLADEAAARDGGSARSDVNQMI